MSLEFCLEDNLEALLYKIEYMVSTQTSITSREKFHLGFSPIHRTKIAVFIDSVYIYHEIHCGIYYKCLITKQSV